MNKIKVLKFLIFSFIILILTGCNGQGKTSPDHVEVIPASIDSKEQASTFQQNSNSEIVIMRKESLIMPNTGVKVRDASMTDNAIFFYGDKGSDVPLTYFYKMSISDHSIRLLDLFYEGKIEGFSADSNGSIFVLGTDEKGAYIITELLPDGSTSKIIIDTSIYSEGIIFNFEAFGEGFIVDNGTEIYALGHDGKIIKSFGKTPHGVDVVRLSGEKAIIILYGSLNANSSGLESSPIRLIYIDSDFNEISRAELTGAYTGFIGGVEEKLFTTLAGTLYEYDYLTGNLHAKFDFSTNNIEIPLFYLGNNCFYSIDYGIPIILNASGSGEAKIITLATYDAEYVLQLVVQRFNEANSDYVIYIEDYAKYNEYDGQDIGLNRYAADVISGNTPDIYDLRAFSDKQYASKGFLEDLTPYFDTDPDISTESLFEPAMRQIYFRDGIYSVVPGFAVLSLCGNSELLPEPFTIKDFSELSNMYDPGLLFGAGMTRERFLKAVLTFMEDELYSRETASCDFTSPEFMEMLEYSALLPEYPKENSGADSGRMFFGTQLLMLQYTGTSFVDFIAYNNTICKGEAVYTGFPSTDGCGSAMVPEMQLGMASDSELKEGVWEFFKYLLSEEIQCGFMNQLFIPINAKALDITINEMISDYFSQPTVLKTPGENNDIAEIHGTLDESTAKESVYALLNSIDCDGTFDKEVLKIIIDSCGAFWGGAKTAQQTAELIQSRVSIYLSEQYG